MYNYDDQKNKLFTDEGQRYFLELRDRVHKLLKEAGAFRFCEAVLNGPSCPGDTFMMHAAIDRMVELDEIRQVTTNVAGQDEVYVAV